jgi:hypothetical protein
MFVGFEPENGGIKIQLFHLNFSMLILKKTATFDRQPRQWVSLAFRIAAIPSANSSPGRLQRPRQLVSTGVLCRKGVTPICLTRKSATSAREMNPHFQSRGSTDAR